MNEWISLFCCCGLVIVLRHFCFLTVLRWAYCIWSTTEKTPSTCPLKYSVYIDVSHSGPGSVTTNKYLIVCSHYTSPQRLDCIYYVNWSDCCTLMVWLRRCLMLTHRSHHTGQIVSGKTETRPVTTKATHTHTHTSYHFLTSTCIWCIVEKLMFLHTPSSHACVDVPCDGMEQWTSVKFYISLLI